jgi:hypothetical protein
VRTTRYKWIVNMIIYSTMKYAESDSDSSHEPRAAPRASPTSNRATACRSQLTAMLGLAFCALAIASVADAEPDVKGITFSRTVTPGGKSSGTCHLRVARTDWLTRTHRAPLRPRTYVWPADSASCAAALLQGTWVSTQDAPPLMPTAATTAPSPGDLPSTCSPT